MAMERKGRRGGKGLRIVGKEQGEKRPDERESKTWNKIVEMVYYL